VAANAMAKNTRVTSDGYVPRGGGRQNRDTSSDGLGPVLVEVTLRLALFAGCVYTSVRFTQFLGKLKERENQVSRVVGAE